MMIVDSAAGGESQCDGKHRSEERAMWATYYGYDLEVPFSNYGKVCGPRFINNRWASFPSFFADGISGKFY